MTTPLNTLLSIPESGIYALINTISMTARVYCSTAIPEALLRFLRECKRRGEDASQWEFMFLDSSLDDVNIAGFWDDLETKGYTMVGKSPVRYTPVIRVQSFNRVLRAFVLLRSKGHLYVTCGVFETMDEAKEFVSIYLSGPIVRPVYANNELTRKFFID